jgi:LCP family protein required for cell wall assembly
MSDTSTQDFFARQAEEARGPETERPPKRRHLLRRILLTTGISMVVLIGAVAGGAYLAVNHLAGSVHRIPNIAALDADQQLGAPSKGMTVLLTDSGLEPGADAQTGLIELLHLNPGQHSGAVVSIPADAVVPVAGHGRIELGETLQLGGPSLMIKTIERLTDVRINHYSVVDFAGLDKVVGAMHGVDVDVPFTTTSDGFTFPAGINRLNSADALAYARQPAVSEIGREELQENLIRAIMDKIASRGFFRHFATNFRVLHAVTRAVSVDSNFSTSQLVSLALHLGFLKGRDGTFVDAPVVHGSPLSGGTRPVHLNNRLSRELWSAIRHNAVAAFARQHPSTVTPGAPA